MLCQLPGDLSRLVKAPCTQPVRMQGHGNDQIRLRLSACREILPQRSREMFGKKAAEIEMMAVFKVADQAVDGKIVGPGGISRIKVRAVTQTIRAGLVRRVERQGTLGATGWGQDG